MDADVLHCPTCGSSELSRAGSYSSFDNHGRFRTDSGKDITVNAARARVCLSCGCLLLFVSDAERDKLRAMEGVTPE